MPRRPSARPATFVRFAAPLVASFLLAISVVVALSADRVSAQTFTPGTQARVAADGDTLRMRTGASVSYPIIASIPDGSVVNIRTGSSSADGYTWQFVDWNGAIGWVAADFLVPLDATATATPSTTASPTATPSATATTPPPPTTGAAGVITGSLPPAGKAGLIVWGGGTMDSLVATASGKSCNVRSVYAIRNGLFVGYTPGAPAFVNASWESQVGTLTSVSALLVFCDASSQSGVSSPPSSGGQIPTGSSPAAPSGGLPPGPGGNEA